MRCNDPRNHVIIRIRIFLQSKNQLNSVKIFSFYFLKNTRVGQWDDPVVNFFFFLLQISEINKKN